MLKFLPLGNNVLLKSLEEKKLTKGGIIIPESARKGTPLFEVVDVHPGFLDGNNIMRHSKLSKGDKVVLDSFGGKEIEIDGKTFVLVREEEVLGKFFEE